MNETGIAKCNALHCVGGVDETGDYWGKVKLEMGVGTELLAARCLADKPFPRWCYRRRATCASVRHRTSQTEIPDGPHLASHLRRRTARRRRLARPVDRGTRRARHLQGFSRRVPVPARHVDRRGDLAVAGGVRPGLRGADLPSRFRRGEMGRRRLSRLSRLEDVDGAGRGARGRDAARGFAGKAVLRRHGGDARQSEDHDVLSGAAADHHRPRLGDASSAGPS